MGMAMKVGDDLCSRGENRRPADFGIENCLARKVRRENPSGTINATAAEYDLTNGEARGIVYARTGLRTINKIIKKGGWALWLELGETLLGEPLDRHIIRERERLHAEQQRAKERDRHLLEVVRHLRPGDHLGG